MAHEGVLTTFSAYGTVAVHRQAEIINGMRTKTASKPDERPLDRETVEKVIAMLKGETAQ